MPIYEYRCDDCAGEFEELVRGDEAAVRCPGCGSAAVTRRLSTFATEWLPSNVEWHRVPGRRGYDD